MSLPGRLRHARASPICAVPFPSSTTVEFPRVRLGPKTRARLSYLDRRGPIARGNRREDLLVSRDGVRELLGLSQQHTSCPRAWVFTAESFRLVRFFRSLRFVLVGGVGSCSEFWVMWFWPFAVISGERAFDACLWSFKGWRKFQIYPFGLQSLLGGLVFAIRCC